MWVIAQLDNCESEFTVHDVVKRAQSVLDKPFGNSQISQMLAHLSEAGLVYKNRWGKYSMAVPLLDQFILRQMPPRQLVLISSGSAGGGLERT
jgi:hypothetical protein